MKKALIVGIIIIILIIVFFVSFIIYNNRNTEGIIVLSYHHILPKEDKEKYKKDDQYVISLDNFEEQMKYLKDNNYNSIDAETLKCYMEKKCSIPEKAFIVTFDDGNISSYYMALPVLEKYGFNSIIFVIGSRINDTTEDWDKADKSNLYFLGEDILSEIHDNHPSMYIGSHSYELHGNINGTKLVDTKTYDELLDDSIKAKEKLFDTTCFAYPFSKKTDNLVKSLKEAGFEMAFISNESRKATQNDDLFSIPRIDINANYSIKDFEMAINERVSLKTYVKRIIKKII